ncbi:DUF1836 domain-containing protein [Bacillus sp. MRMR6]|uniref:DUF1836 domain-containing protein n=1 Tax=Bacillus sp. MRMR6 TaxID=1928617 RepID=UPI000951B532|nr:DUF1836 domain-containing protein [Bacillus sp. MRMR6]OLS37228.1 hypothetical protein BTR25_16565 [Bacillus sp. MRMR6]
MELFQLSRKTMAEFLFSLTSVGTKLPKQILEEARASIIEKVVKEGALIGSGTAMPPIFEKLLKTNSPIIGLSINQIVELGNQIEFTHLTPTAVQNWVKREVKQLIGSPQLGKKYTVEQAATLFIVEDLKASLDFDSIGKILALLFNNPEDREDDVIDPLRFYHAYATIFEKIYYHSGENMHQNMDQFIQKEALKLVETFEELSREQKNMVSSILLTASLSVFSAYYKTLTRKYCTAALLTNGEW